MPNYPSIYLELQELWKRLRSSNTDVSSLDSRLTAVEQDIADGVPPSGPAGGVLRGEYPNPSALGSPDNTDTINIHPYDDSTDGKYIIIKSLNGDTTGNSISLRASNGSNFGGTLTLFGGTGGSTGGDVIIDGGPSSLSAGQIYIGTEHASNINIGYTVEPGYATTTNLKGVINATDLNNVGSDEYHVIVKKDVTNELATVSVMDLASQITVHTDDINITGSGTESNPIALKSNITASNILVTNNITVQGTASIAQLNTINQQSLQVGDKYITIMSGGTDHIGLDGAGILWGSGSTGPTVDENGSNAYIKFRSTGDQLEIYPGLKISGSLSASVGISGSFSGSKATISQVTASNFQATGIPASSETNVVVVDSNGVFGKTTLSELNNPYHGSILYSVPGYHYFPVPLNAKFIRIVAIGGGGGGSSGDIDGKPGTGGGGGGYSSVILKVSDISSSLNSGNLLCVVAQQAPPENDGYASLVLLDDEYICVAGGGKKGIKSINSATNVKGGNAEFNGGSSVNYYYGISFEK